ncbi:14202_t:CDS:2, partial [Cetraspora pellucida]
SSLAASLVATLAYISNPKEPVLPILVFTNVDMCAIFTWDENAIAVSVPPLIFFIRLVSFIVPVAIEKITRIMNEI